MIKTVNDLATFGKFRVMKNNRGYYSAQFGRKVGLDYQCSSSLRLSLTEAIDDLITRVNKDYSTILLYDNQLKEEN